MSALLHLSSLHFCSHVPLLLRSPLCFFFTDPATTEIYTLSLHDALPICRRSSRCASAAWASPCVTWRGSTRWPRRSSPTSDRKSTRLNSSHLGISYAVFCLKKKKKKIDIMKEVCNIHYTLRYNTCTYTIQ